MKICRQPQISKIKNKGLKCFTLKIEAAVKNVPEQVTGLHL